MESTVSLPTAAEMALCVRNPARKGVLMAKIDGYFANLRRGIVRPPRGNLTMIKKYSETMGRLREHEEASRAMLEAFSRGDVRGIREACERMLNR